MKSRLSLCLLLLALATSQAQQVYVNPSSVTLTQQGTVSVIVTDNASTSKTDTATVGSIQAIYYNNIAYWAANQGPNQIAASGVSTGVLDAGTYTVTVNGNPQQVTVILWNESTGQGLAISQVELAYNAASATDQTNFQSFIASLVQEQLTSLQSQITALQDSDANQNASLSSLTSSYNALQSQLAATSTTDGSSANDEDTHDNTIAYVGVGLGTAGVIGAIMNAIFDSKSDGTHDNQ